VRAIVVAMRGLLGAPMVVVAAGAALALWACSGNPQTAVLYLVVHGEGQVAVSRTANEAACQANSCTNGASTDGGALEIPYADNSVLGMMAEPSPGWQFTSWQWTVSGSSASSTSTQPTLIIEHAGDGMSVLATFSEAGAPDAAPVSDADAEPPAAGDAGPGDAGH
jgi:hypothetical protein